jgi:hypothetical protein
VKAVTSRFWVSVAGLSPETIALILALGLVLGIFPVFGCPTLLCVLAAVMFRLNLPAIQLVNQLSSPLQLALLIPLGRAGAHIERDPAAWSLSSGARHAIVGWLCLCIPLGFVLYLILVFALRRHRHRCFNGVENPG